VTVVEAVVLVVLALLAWFSCRRLILIAAALAPRRSLPHVSDTELPPVTVIVPARDEAAHAARLLSSLEELEYPADRLSFVLVSDGSRDGTEEEFSRWAAGRPRARVVVLQEHHGKGRALNAALELAGDPVVVILDSDLVPEPGCLRPLVAALAEEGVHAAGALLRPANPRSGTVARYASLDYAVNQLVTSAGKDRLGFDPPVFGAGAFRRQALRAIGDFTTEAGEDVEASLALNRAGGRTRFVPDAVVRITVVTGLHDYWRQHIRWARGNFRARKPRTGPKRQSALKRLEAWSVAAGYADRVAFLSAVVLAGAQRLPWWIPVAYLAVPATGALVALARAGLARETLSYAASALLLFPIDVAGSAVAVAMHAARRPQRWSSPRPQQRVDRRAAREEAA
jgi:cellulose synthase/poly-beta-1,6-N-acetylglucosamine synthase-like glycosyltransferase